MTAGDRPALWHTLATLALALLPGACRDAGGPPPPQEGAFLRVCVDHALTSLDPHEGTGFSSGLELLANVYEPVVQLDARLSVQPALAESWTTPDDRTLVLALRSGVRFHDGRGLAAGDVVYSLERARKAEFEARYYLADVASVRALDPRHVELRTRRPSPALLNRLSFVMVVPEGSDNTRLRSAADGTGPYRVTGFQPGVRLELRRNDRWWRPAPAVARALIQFGVLPQRAVEDLVARRYDFAALGFDPHAAALPASPRHELIVRDSVFVTYLGMDVARAHTPQVPLPRNPFLDRRVRQAISLGLDRRRLAERLPGQPSPASQLVPRAVFGFDPGIDEIRPDPGRARALLAEAGLESGFRVRLHTRQRYADSAPAVVEQLAGLGIAAELVVLEDHAYFRALEQRELSLWLDNWGCTTGESGELFENALHSRDAESGLGAFNETGLSDPELDREVERSLTALDRDARRRALQGLMRRALLDLAWIPLFNGQDLFGIDRRYRWQPRLDFSFRLVEVEPRPPAGP